MRVLPSWLCPPETRSLPAQSLLIPNTTCVNFSHSPGMILCRTAPTREHTQRHNPQIATAHCCLCTRFLQILRINNTVNPQKCAPITSPSLSPHPPTSTPSPPHPRLSPSLLRPTQCAKGENACSCGRSPLPTPPSLAPASLPTDQAVGVALSEFLSHRLCGSPLSEFLPWRLCGLRSAS